MYPKGNTHTKISWWRFWEVYNKSPSPKEEERKESIVVKGHHMSPDGSPNMWLPNVR